MEKECITSEGVCSAKNNNQSDIGFQLRHYMAKLAWREIKEVTNWVFNVHERCITK